MLRPPPMLLPVCVQVYRFWLEFLALPTFIGALYVPQVLHSLQS